MKPTASKTMSDNTKSDWYYFRAENFACPPAIIDNRTGKTICEFDLADTPRCEIDDNAQLIAAAPDMLEALEGILTLIQESHGVFGFHLNGDLSDWSEHQDDINLIQNAIAKATGKEARNEND
jgi:hypothetical protein